MTLTPARGSRLLTEQQAPETHPLASGAPPLYPPAPFRTDFGSYRSKNELVYEILV
jgi:hypothetical protein